MSTTIDQDFHAWAYEQAARVRAGEPLDVENVAEGLEDLAKDKEQQLTNRLAVLLQHLLKCEYQPDRITGLWQPTIKEQRRRIARLLAKNPSLRPKLSECIANAYQAAVIFASVETQIIEDDFASTCEYTEEEILGDAE